MRLSYKCFINGRINDFVKDFIYLLMRKNIYLVNTLNLFIKRGGVLIIIKSDNKLDFHYNLFTIFNSFDSIKK